MSAREKDINGWYEVKDNPLSKVGVFPYTGRMIDSNGEFGLDPDKIYNVFRSEEELSDPETIDSFKLVPWIDDHVMLGSEKKGLLPAEKKGVSGVIGQTIYFDSKDLTLKGNVKVWSEMLKDEIEEGKKELSLGYYCDYEKKNGIHGGQGYEFMQKCIRGNHMASVDEGRMGSEVAVMDGGILTFTIDSKEFKKMAMTPEEMEEFILKLAESMKSLTEQVGELVSSKTEDKEDPEKKETEDAEEDPEKKAEDMEESEDTEDEEDPEKKKDSEGMDSLKADNKAFKKTIKNLTATVDSLEKNGMKTLIKIISKRDLLANQLSKHIGTFDHAEMTLDEVAVYGAKKLELICDKGTELSTLNGFLHNRNPETIGHALDAKTSGESMEGLNNYLEGPDKK